MLISGVRKTTLIDYPGKVAAIVFTLGCNLRCHYCHNYEFVLPEHVKDFMSDLIPEEAFFNFLKTRIGFLDGVVITGGEPTLQKDLEAFIRKVKDLGLLVKLDTNGRDYAVIERLIAEGLLDYVAMDIKYPFGMYTKMTGVEEDSSSYRSTKDLLMGSGIDYEFRTTVAKGYFDEGIIAEIGRSIRGAKRWYLQNFEEKNVLNPGFSGKTFDPEGLEALRKAGSGYVDECSIRK